MSIFHGFRRHILDAMTGGGDLNKNLFPKELRNAVPKEIQPGGFDPAKQWFGYDIKADPAHDAKVADRQATQAAWDAYNQGAPQLRSGAYGSAALGNAGILQPPPPQSVGMPAQPQPGFTPNGPYGQQAAQMAGILGQSQGQINQVPSYPTSMPALGPGSVYQPGKRPFFGRMI